MGAKIKTELIVTDLYRVHELLERSPTHGEYCIHGKFNTITIRRNLGINLWDDILISIGLKPTTSPKTFKYTENDIYTELQRIESIVGRKPSWTDVKTYSTISDSTIERRIGRSNQSVLEPESVIHQTFNLDKISIEHGSWVAGLVDGEGSFVISKSYCVQFRIGLRADDISTLELVKDILQLECELAVGSNSKRRAMGQRVGDEVRLSVTNRQVCRNTIIPFFNKFKLRSKKAIDFKIFSDAVLFMCKRDDEGRYRKRLTQDERDYMNHLREQLTALRFDPTSAIIS